jgi:hypothetical protein
MSGLTDNFLLDPLLRQPFLGSEREDSDNKLIATVVITPPELDISSFAAVALSQDSLAPHGSNFIF